MSATRACTSQAPRRISSKRVGSNPYSVFGRPATALNPTFGSSWPCHIQASPPSSVGDDARLVVRELAGEAAGEGVRWLDDVVVDRDDRVAPLARLGLGEERHLVPPALAAAERARGREIVDRHPAQRRTSSPTSGTLLRETPGVTVLVIGAAGDLGGRVVRELRALSTPVRAFVRRPEAVGEIDAAEVVLGDLGDMSSVMAASEGVRAVFLVSSPSRAQVELETNVIEAAERTGIERIVKVSNIPVPGLESGLHGNHRTIERRLDRSPVASTVLQPTFFTTVMDRQRDLIARGTVVLPFGKGRIAWIDPDDIAAVAAVALTRDIEGPLRLTGPESLDGDEVAARLGVRRLDPPLADWHERVVASGLDPWLAASTVELYAAVARGALDHVSPDVERALGRPPRRAFVTQNDRQ